MSFVRRLDCVNSVDINSKYMSSLAKVMSSKFWVYLKISQVIVSIEYT